MNRIPIVVILALMLSAGCLGGGADVVVRGEDARIIPRPTYDYAGERFTRAEGTLRAAVDTDANKGSIDATVREGPDTFEVNWVGFLGTEEYQSGGAARGIRVHGSTGNGSSELPEFLAYLACYGRATVARNGELELDPTSGSSMFDARLLVARGHVRDPETGIIYNDVRNAPYDPARPEAAWVNATGSQAILQLRTETGEIWHHFEFEEVILEKY